MPNEYYENGASMLKAIGGPPFTDLIELGKVMRWLASGRSALGGDDSKRWSDSWDDIIITANEFLNESNEKS